MGRRSALLHLGALPKDLVAPGDRLLHGLLVTELVDRELPVHRFAEGFAGRHRDDFPLLARLVGVLREGDTEMTGVRPRRDVRFGLRAPPAAVPRPGLRGLPAGAAPGRSEQDRAGRRRLGAAPADAGEPDGAHRLITRSSIYQMPQMAFGSCSISLDSCLGRTWVSMGRSVVDVVHDNGFQLSCRYRK